MDDLRDLLADAREAAGRAYAPYSRFRVGAVVVADDGRRFFGVNVENAAYGSTMCAEAVAIAAAATAGVRKIDAVVVACLDEELCYPCGNCRQLMREFGASTVVVQGPSGPVVHDLESLLPHAFGPDDLDGASGAQDR
jgi:cytidine deaminase